MTADPITEALEGALDETFDASYEFYLAALPEGTNPAEVPDEGGLFQITDMSSAEWALRKIRKAKSLITEADETAKVQIDAVMAKVEELLAPIHACHQAETAKHEQTVRFFEQLLGTFHRKLLAADPERKTLKLSFGTLKSRAGQPRFVFAPEFVEWARAGGHDTFVRIKYEADAVEAKKAMTIVENIDGDTAAFFDGEIVPGVEVTPADTTFTVEVTA